MRLNLRQKLAEVRRRIGYIQKRGHNERFNYSYVTAADIAGSVGDILSELGVVVIPCLENITYESAPGRGETTRMAQVVMAYTFSDVDSGEEIVAKVAGQGLDTGDKAPYKAMTGALKYALLQSFLLATGDDPEDERMETRLTAPGSDRPIGADEVRELERLIGETGDRPRTGTGVLQGRLPRRDERNRISAGNRGAQAQARENRHQGDGPCPGLNGSNRIRPNGIAGGCRGSGRATRRWSWATRPSGPGGISGR